MLEGHNNNGKYNAVFILGFLLLGGMGNLWSDWVNVYMIALVKILH